MPDDIKNLFAGIPENAKICIWGAANAGRSIKEELAKSDNDETILYAIPEELYVK